LPKKFYLRGGTLFLCPDSHFQLSHFRDTEQQPTKWFGRPYGGKFLKHENYTYLVLAPKPLQTGELRERVPSYAMSQTVVNNIYPPFVSSDIPPKVECMLLVRFYLILSPWSKKKKA
jgi:hypothetical protein